MKSILYYVGEILIYLCVINVGSDVNNMSALSILVIFSWIMHFLWVLSFSWLLQIQDSMQFSVSENFPSNRNNKIRSMHLRLTEIVHLKFEAHGSAPSPTGWPDACFVIIQFGPIEDWAGPKPVLLVWIKNGLDPAQPSPAHSHPTEKITWSMTTRSIPFWVRFTAPTWLASWHRPRFL